MKKNCFSRNRLKVNDVNGTALMEFQSTKLKNKLKNKYKL